MNTLKHDQPPENSDSNERLAEVYESEKPRLLARLRAAGRSLEKAEDLVHDVYTETMERLPLVAGIRNLPAWINSLFTRRLIDAWCRAKAICSSVNFDFFIRDCLLPRILP